MKLNRSQNAIRNASYGIINKVIGIIFPFVVRTVFIYTLGAEYLGLNSLFTSILTVLNLTELGFSSAVVFCMYEPIANDDTDAINALLMFYKKVYLYIGLIILGIGAILIPFLPQLINGSYPPNINLVAVYIVYLVNTVISYFLFAYLQALISAFQREDVLSKVNIVLQSIMYIIQIVILLSIHNYYIYIFTMPVFTVINNIRTAVLAKRMFPQYKPYGKLDKKYKDQIKEKIRGLVINKLCIVSRNAFDSIFISMFLGLTDTAIYNNYYYILNAVVMVTSVLVTSVVAGAGNSVALETSEKNYYDMQQMNFIYMWIAGWLTVCMLCLYQPFMRLWVGEKLMYPTSCVVLLCFYFYILKMSDVRYIYELAKGLWWENRYRSIAEAIANLLLNFFLGKFFGVYGIIIATIISIFFINYLYGTRIIFKYYFTENSIMDYFISQFKYGVCAIIVCCITYFASRLIPETMLGFVFKFLICMTIPNIIFWIIYRKTTAYKNALRWFILKLPKSLRVKMNERL